MSLTATSEHPVRQRARRTVVRWAIDDPDARLLLDMLGLIPGPDEER